MRSPADPNVGLAAVTKSRRTLLRADRPAFAPREDAIRVLEMEPGTYCLWWEAGSADVEDVIVELGHQPNICFRDGIVELLVTTEAAPARWSLLNPPRSGAFVA